MTDFVFLQVPFAKLSPIALGMAIQAWLHSFEPIAHVLF
jgi:hypothetical protein